MTDVVTKYGSRLKLTAYVFVGLHVPLVIAGIVCLVLDQFDVRTILLSVLIGTIIGLVISLYGIWSVFRDQETTPA